jgi:transcriptional regulator with XRE-family HTH domain
MENLKENIAHNLTELRKNKKLTQSELAEKFNYSDKAVSKWEHGEALPGIDTLQQLADFYGVTLDYLTHSITPENKKQFVKSVANSVNKGVITALAVSLAWLLAIIIALGTDALMKDMYWMAYIWAIPFSLLICLIFNRIWGKNSWGPGILTFFIWTLLGALYIELGLDLPDGSGWKMWTIFLLGIPSMAAAILWSHLKTAKAD